MKFLFVTRHNQENLLLNVLVIPKRYFMEINFRLLRTYGRIFGINDAPSWLNNKIIPKMCLYEE